MSHHSHLLPIVRTASRTSFKKWRLPKTLAKLKNQCYEARRHWIYPRSVSRIEGTMPKNKAKSRYKIWFKLLKKAKVSLRVGIYCKIKHSWPADRQHCSRKVIKQNRVRSPSARISESQKLKRVIMKITLWRRTRRRLKLGGKLVPCLTRRRIIIRLWRTRRRHSVKYQARPFRTLKRICSIWSRKETIVTS